MARMPNDAVDLIPWFRSVEKLFSDFSVGDSLKVHLIKPHLSEEARNFIARMDPIKASNFEEVKKKLLHEFKLSSSTLLDRFNSVSRSVGETYTLYGSRLKSLLTYYVQSRKVDTLELMIDLLVSDRIKSRLTEGALRHILSLENQQEAGWLKFDELVDALDVFYSTHSVFDVPRNTNAAVSGGKGAGPPSRPPPPNRTNQFSAHVQQQQPNRFVAPVQYPVAPGTDSKTQPKRCYVCNSDKHLAKFHKGNEPGGRAKVNACLVSTPASVTREATTDSTLPDSVDCRADKRPTPTNLAPASVHELVVQSASVDPLCETSVSIDDVIQPVAKLTYINVCLNDGEKQCKGQALVDSGAEICLVHTDVLHDLDVIKQGDVRLRGIIGPSVDADVCYVKVKLDNDSCTCEPLNVAFAVSPVVNDRLILTSEVVSRLLPHRFCNVVRTAVIHTRSRPTNDDGNSCVVSDSDADDDVVMDDDVVSTAVGKNVTVSLPVTDLLDVPDGVSADTVSTVIDSEIDMSSICSNSDALRAEQVTDDSLKSCHALAKRGKGGFFYRDDLLFKRDHILGQSFDRLVLPECRRNQVLKLAHDTCGAHMGVRNTKERIRYSFFWPTIASDVKTYVRTCKVCALRQRITCYDRVPITPIERDDKSFNHWFCDVLGPIFPNQKVNFNYCFVCCDSNTRWPAAFPIKAVTS
jgi:hypothetical protein